MTLPAAHLDPELEECLNSASEAELTDIAGDFCLVVVDLL